MIKILFQLRCHVFIFNWNNFFIFPSLFLRLVIVFVLVFLVFLNSFKLINLIFFIWINFLGSILHLLLFSLILFIVSIFAIISIIVSSSTIISKVSLISSLLLLEMFVLNFFWYFSFCFWASFILLLCFLPAWLLISKHIFNQKLNSFTDYWFIIIWKIHYFFKSF